MARQMDDAHKVTMYPEYEKDAELGARQEIIDYIAKYVKLPEGVIRGDAEYRRTVKR